MSSQIDPAPKKILLVEDDQSIRELYVSILQAEGYVLDVAIDGEQAYQSMTGQEYDLILLDILLPKMSGMDILEKLQHEEKHAVTKRVVLLTNLSQESVVAQAVAYGIRGYIVKSDYTPDQIIQEVNNNLVS